MKYLFLLLLTFNVFAETPPANAYKANVYGYEVAVFVNVIFPSEYGIRALYFSDGGWIYLAEPSCFVSNIQTSDDADFCFSSAIDEINAAMDSALQPINAEPNGGTARLQWLIENKLKVQGNQLVFVQ